MSDIKTLREAAEMLLHESEQDDGACDERFIMRIVGILCRREIERMEGEAKQEPEYGGEAFTGEYMNGWNAAIKAAAQMALDCDTMGEDYADDELTEEGKAARRKCREIFTNIDSLRKGPSND